MKSLETITRKDLIECLVSNQIPLTNPRFNRCCQALEIFDNQFLCNQMFKYTGVLLVPKTSQLLEFLN